MARSSNLSLTDDLRAFLDESSGDGTLFSTPSESVRALIREKKDRQDAAALREAVLEGYDDVLHGRTRVFTGDLRAMLDDFRAERRGSRAICTSRTGLQRISMRSGGTRSRNGVWPLLASTWTI